MPSDADIAWATGLFEGEGSICIFSQPPHHRHQQVRLQLGMNDRDVVERFRSVVGCGKVHPEKRFRPPRRPHHVWTVGNRADVKRILEAFLPWFGERRTAKAVEALAEANRFAHLTCELCGVEFAAKRHSRFCSNAHRCRAHYLKRTAAA